MVKQRSALDSIPAYKQGAMPSTSDVVKLSSNENPFPPLASVRAAVAEELERIHLYPSMAAPELTSRVAKLQGVEPENIVFGAGSVEVATQLVQASAGEGDEVMFAWRSFEAYPIIAIGAASHTDSTTATSTIDAVEINPVPRTTRAAPSARSRCVRRGGTGASAKKGTRFEGFACRIRTSPARKTTAPVTATAIPITSIPRRYQSPQRRATRSLPPTSTPTGRYASVAVFPGASADSVATQLASIFSLSSEGVFGSAVYVAIRRPGSAGSSKAS